MKKLSFMVAILLTVALQACSSSSSSDTADEPGFLSNESDLSVPASLTAASRGYLFDYMMTGVNGDSVTARAQLFEPLTSAPADGHPLVVWAHGTTGIANACQPSANFERFTNASALNALLGAGYAVLAPDYEGFGTDSIHPYYVRSSHANAITESIPAAHELEGVNISDDWAIVGHSQGGHVALATARAEALPAYPLQAVVALAPGTDLQPFSEAAFNAIDQDVAQGNFNVAGDRLFYLNVYAAFVAHALSEVEAEFDPSSIFGDDMRDLIDMAVTETECNAYANTVANTLNEYFELGGGVLDFQGVSRTWYEDPILSSHLESEALSDEAQAAPLLIVQGDADRQIPLAAIDAFVDQQRSIGTDVTYQIVEGARHGDVANAEFFRVIDWLATRFPAQ